MACQISKFNDISFVINTLNKALEKEKDVYGLSFIVTKASSMHLASTKSFTFLMVYLFQWAKKGAPLDDSPIESWHAILKKETLYNNDIISLEHYIQLAEEWIVFIIRQD